MKRTTSEDQVAAARGGELSGAVPEAARRPLRELMDDRLLDALLERSRNSAGGTGRFTSPPFLLPGGQISFRSRS